jgi:hypothetical protein
MGADKNSSRRRWRLQQDEHNFQHTSPTHYPSWPSPHNHWSATGLRNQQTTFRAKTHQHAQHKLARLTTCAAPVRPMACAGQTGNTGQTGGYSSRTTSVPESLSDFSKPWNKNTPKTQPARKENSTQSLAKQLQTDQELTSSTTTQRHTSQAVSPEANPTSAIHQSDRSHTPVRPVKPRQLGMNNTRGSTPPNPNFDLPNRSTDLNKTLGIV